MTIGVMNIDSVNQSVLSNRESFYLNDKNLFIDFDKQTLLTNVDSVGSSFPENVFPESDVVGNVLGSEQILENANIIPGFNEIDLVNKLTFSAINPNLDMHIGDATITGFHAYQDFHFQNQNPVLGEVNDSAWY